MKNFLLTICFCTAFSLAFAQNEPYKNPSLPAAERADDLLSRLTLEEKVGLMRDVSAPVERLGIPVYNWWNEALHGVGRAGLATVFPQSIGLAATFDDAAVQATFDAVSDEARAKFHDFRKKGEHGRYQGLTFWTPNINIFRDPRWGRGQETYGEDPYLTGRMGVAVVNGLQGPADARYDKLHACAKHYAVHSGPEWNRHSFNAENVSPRDLWETYLPAFKELVQEADVKEVMCAYNRFEGDPCCGSKTLLVKILRDEWGYDNIIVSDCGAISDFFEPNRHGTHKAAADASADAVLSGTDLECGNNYASLVDAAKKGLIDEEQIDTSVRRLLKARFELGEMDPDNLVPWSKIPYSVVNSKKHQDMALDMAHKSMTLLQNRNNVLPLAKSGQKIIVMGANATDSIMQWGNYNGTPAHTVTILDAIRKKIGNIPYIKGCDLVAKEAYSVKDSIEKVKDADIIIFVGGISPRLEGEEMPVNYPGFRGGDRTEIELPAVQREMLKALKDAGKKVVFVNCSGSAIALASESENCDAILQAWYPGQAGGTAVADVLFGDYNPAGRLPVTFYKSTSQLPDFEDYSMKGRTYRYMTDKPLFAFGYGLSYTTFAYSNAKLARTSIKAGESTSLTLTLANTGKRDGDEVVQVYIRNLQDPQGPVKMLRAFRRIHLEAGASENVAIDLPASTFECFDPETNTMHVKPGKYVVMYGGSSMDENLQSLEIALNY